MLGCKLSSTHRAQLRCRHGPAKSACVTRAAPRRRHWQAGGTIVLVCVNESWRPVCAANDLQSATQWLLHTPVAVAVVAIGAFLVVPRVSKVLWKFVALPVAFTLLGWFLAKHPDTAGAALSTAYNLGTAHPVAASIAIAVLAGLLLLPYVFPLLLTAGLAYLAIFPVAVPSPPSLPNLSNLASVPSFMLPAPLSQARDGVNAATKSWRTQLQLPASPLAMLDAPASTPDHSQRPTPQYAPSDSPQAGSSRADVSNADARSGDRAGVSGGDRARASPLRSARRSQGEMLDAELGIDRRERTLSLAPLGALPAPDVSQPASPPGEDVVYLPEGQDLPLQQRARSALGSALTGAKSAVAAKAEGLKQSSEAAGVVASRTTSSVSESAGTVSANMSTLAEGIKERVNPQEVAAAGAAAGSKVKDAGSEASRLAQDAAGAALRRAQTSYSELKENRRAKAELAGTSSMPGSSVESGSAGEATRSLIDQGEQAAKRVTERSRALGSAGLSRLKQAAGAVSDSSSAEAGSADEASRSLIDQGEQTAKRVTERSKALGSAGLSRLKQAAGAVSDSSAVAESLAKVQAAGSSLSEKAASVRQRIAE